jgi:hypothetical protein
MVGSVSPLVVRRLSDEPAGVVDDWGRDAGLVRGVMHLARLRWEVVVSGDERLPRRSGALIVVNTRPLALTALYTAFAVSEATDRPVRFVGRPDTAPIGAFLRRLGGLLDQPDEVQGALAAGELVVMGADHDDRVGTVGRVDHALIGAAVATNVPVHPAATSSFPVGRAARVAIGRSSRSPRDRRGPLTELELADQVRSDIGRLLQRAP